MAISHWPIALALTLVFVGVIYVWLRWRRSPQAYHPMIGVAVGYFIARALASRSLIGQGGGRDLMKLRWILSAALLVVPGLVQITPARAETYGAIAYSERNAFYAWSVDQGSAEGADLRALSSCAKEGDGCKVVASF